MAKYSPAIACTILDHLAHVDPNLQACARHFKLSHGLFWQWCSASIEDEKAFDRGEIVESKYLLPEWQGRKNIWFHTAYSHSRELFALMLDSVHKSQMLKGVPRQVFADGGKVAYEIDHKLLADFEGDADAASKLGVHDPFYRHAEDGSRIPMIVYDPLPASLQQHGLRVALPRLHNIATEENVNVNSTSRVLVIDDRPREQPLTPLREDLLARYEALKLRKTRPVPEGKVEILHSDDRVLGPERVALPAPRENPRAYRVEPPKPKPQPSYARAQPPQSVADYSGVGHGTVLPGGHKVR
jgi:hypothetical protein